VGLTFIAIVLLVAAWAALLLPDLRGRGGPSRRSDSIASFSRQLSTLERARPGQRPSARVVAFPQRGAAQAAAPARRASGLAPVSAAQARQRRRRLLFGLAAAALATLVAGVVLSPLFLVLHLLVDAALGGFVWLLVEHRNRTYERETKRQLMGLDDRAFERTRRRASVS
jgi:Flp pilus assembly protein TadB